MAERIPGGGWAITDEEAAEVIRLSEQRDEEVWQRRRAAERGTAHVPGLPVAVMKGSGFVKIPNDDPACHCSVADKPCESADAIPGLFADDPDTERRVWLRLDCPHHGPVVRAVREIAAPIESAG